MGTLRFLFSSDQMGHHRTDLLAIEGFIDEPVNSKVDGFFEKRIAFLGNHQKDPCVSAFFDFKKKVFLSDAGGIYIEDNDIKNLLGKMRVNLKNIVYSGYAMAFSFQTFPQITPAREVVIDDANLAPHPRPHPSKIWSASSSWNGDSPFLFKPVLEDHLVNDFSAKNAPPSGEFLTDPVKLFIYHHAATTMTSHV